MTEPDWPICFECGNDYGPYKGLCLDCLEVAAPVRVRYVMTPEQYDSWHYQFCNGTSPCPLCDLVVVKDIA